MTITLIRIILFLFFISNKQFKVSYKKWIKRKYKDEIEMVDKWKRNYLYALFKPVSRRQNNFFAVQIRKGGEEGIRDGNLEGMGALFFGSRIHKDMKNSSFHLHFDSLPFYCYLNSAFTFNTFFTQYTRVFTIYNEGLSWEIESYPKYSST